MNASQLWLSVVILYSLINKPINIKKKKNREQDVILMKIINLLAVYLKKKVIVVRNVQNPWLKAFAYLILN